MTRSTLTVVTVLGLAALVAGSAGAATGASSNHRLRTTTGDITRIDLSHITVGGLTCELPTASDALSGNLALGERVTIGCLGKILRLIRHHGLTITGISGSNGSNGSTGVVITGSNGTSSSSAVTAASTGGNANSTSVSTSSSTDAAGTTTSISAEGPVSAITSTSISIGSATCPFDRASYPAQSPVAQLQVGDVAKFSCKTLPDGTTTGSVSTP